MVETSYKSHKVNIFLETILWGFVTLGPWKFSKNWKLLWLAVDLFIPKKKLGKNFNEEMPNRQRIKNIGKKNSSSSSSIINGGNINTEKFHHKFYVFDALCNVHIFVRWLIFFHLLFISSLFSFVGREFTQVGLVKKRCGPENRIYR